MIARRIIQFFSMTLLLVNAQYNNVNFYAEKPGSCPPPLSVDFCKNSCVVDGHCPTIAKCCPTSCGGTICSKPVTMRDQKKIEKPGACPSPPTGRWVCSSTCSSDSDCRGTNKCCTNRCGAFACQKPAIEVIESVEIPYNVPGEITYNDVPNRNSNPYFGIFN